MNEKITTSELADLLAKEARMTNEEANAFIKRVFSSVTDALQDDKYLKIKGLGTFKLISVSNRESVDVNTGERILIEGYNKISFTPETALRDLINKPFAHFETVSLSDEVEFEEEEEVPEAPETEPEVPESEEVPAIKTDVQSAPDGRSPEEIIKILLQELEEEMSEQEEEVIPEVAPIEEKAAPEKTIPAVPEPTLAEQPEEPVQEKVRPKRKRIFLTPSEEPVQPAPPTPPATPEVEEKPAEKPVQEETPVQEIPKEIKTAVTWQELAQEVEETEEAGGVVTPPEAQESVAEEAPASCEEALEEVIDTEEPAPVEEDDIYVPAEEEGALVSFEEGKPAVFRRSYAIPFWICLTLLAGGLLSIAIMYYCYPEKLKEFFGAEEQKIIIMTVDSENASSTIVPDADALQEPVAEQPKEPAKAKEKKDTKTSEKPAEKAGEPTQEGTLQIVDGRASPKDFKAVGTLTTQTIVAGSSLARISKQYYGSRDLWTLIVEYNKDIITNPDNVPVGTTIKIPKLERK